MGRQLKWRQLGDAELLSEGTDFPKKKKTSTPANLIFFFLPTLTSPRPPRNPAVNTLHSSSHTFQIGFGEVVLRRRCSAVCWDGMYVRKRRDGRKSPSPLCLAAAAASSLGWV